MCASLQLLVKVVREHVEETRSLEEVAEAYQVPMARARAAQSAQVEYLAVLKQMDCVLICYQRLLDLEGLVSTSDWHFRPPP